MAHSISDQLSPAVYVSTPEALARFTERWLPMVEDSILALDIEEDRGYRYRPSVSLIQVSVNGQDAILDPMTLGVDTVEPVVRTLLHSAARVLLHGGHNDVAGLRRDFEAAPKRIGDTQIAARFLGIRQFGLSKLLQSRLGLVIDKKERRSDWGKRPLSRSQLRYAQRDTSYLEALWDQLFHAAVEAGWEDAIWEECAALQQTPAEDLQFDPHGWMKIKGMRRQSEAVQHRAAQLWAWRDYFGKKHNVHPSHVFPKWALEQAAIRGIQWATQYDKVRERLCAISPTACDTLRESIERFEPVPTPTSPNTNKSPSKEAFSAERLSARYNALHQWRQKEADRQNMEPGWLAPKSVLDIVTHADANTLDTLPASTEIRQWRVDRYADIWRTILLRN